MEKDGALKTVAVAPMEKDGVLKTVAVAVATAPEQEGTHQATRWAQAQWASIKRKARGASEYAVLRTRQGISMFGEPSLGSLVKASGASASAHESSQSQ